MTDLEKLKPCPFCGGEADYIPAWGFRCRQCGAGVPGRHSDGFLWNTRAADAALLVAERALRGAQSVLADLTNPDEPSGSQIVTMYARCRSAEFSARAALSEIEKLTGGGE